MVQVTFSILSLNCWGLKYISKHRSSRFKAISAYLKEGLYDFVCLQEVWVKSDYLFLASELVEVLPHSKYFESGIIGSGLCIFSKVPIRRFFFMPFQANGYYYKVWHGDWFSGKGVALCQVIYNGLVVNLLTTHTHVETSGSEYVAHRVTQAVCLVDMISLCLERADITILAGDLNSDPDGPLFNLLSRLSGLYDAFMTAESHFTHPTLQLQQASQNQGRSSYHNGVDTGGTCGLPSNRYASKHYLKRWPTGWRLDYILYRLPVSTMNIGRIRVPRYSRPLPNRIPPQYGFNISYSDHEAVGATFCYECPASIVSSSSVDISHGGLRTLTDPLLLESSKNIRTTRGLKEVGHGQEGIVGAAEIDSETRSGTSSMNVSDPFFPRNVSLTPEKCGVETTTSAASLCLEENQMKIQKACVLEAMSHLETSIQMLKKAFRIHLIVAFLLLILLLGTLYLPCLPAWATVLSNLFRIMISLMFFAIAFIQPIHINREIHTLASYLQSLQFKLSESGDDDLSKHDEVQ